MVFILSGRKTEYIRYMVNQHKCWLSQTYVILAILSYSIITFPVSHFDHHIPSIIFPTLIDYLRRDTGNSFQNCKMPVLACSVLAYFMLACSIYWVVLMLMQFCLYNLISLLVLFLNSKPISHHMQLNY